MTVTESLFAMGLQSMSDDELMVHVRKVKELDAQTSTYGRAVAAEAKRRYDARFPADDLPPLKVEIIDYGPKR